jgi:F-box interacting protein
MPDDQDMDCSFVPVPVSRLIENPGIIIRNDPYYCLKNMDCRRVVGSCNGLLCLVDYYNTINHRHIWIRFWNPATNKLSDKLGYLCHDRRNSESEFFNFTFGYDISNDIYKVVAFSINKVKVFSLGDNVWRNIQSFPVVPFDLGPSGLRCHPFLNDGVYVSGTINWLAIRNTTKYEWNDSIEQFVIVSLDLATETYRQLLPPSGFVEVPPVEPSVTVLMDCLCFSHRFEETHFVLWKMMEFGVQESWTQFLKISFEDLQIDYGILNWYAYDWQLFLLPLCASESSNTLIMASNRGRYTKQYQHAILYNWIDNKVEKTRSINNMLWFSAKG